MTVGAAGFAFDDVSVVVASGVAIVDRVTLDLSDGGLTVIAGPSGSGKSTLLRLCNRLGVPSSGRVSLGGTDIATLDPLALRRRAGMVFQKPVTFAGTVRDNMIVAGAGADDGRFRDALDGVGLDPSLLDRQADGLSGGEAQRMCIARTLLTGPETLLMDEATSALDIDARLVIEGLARKLVAGGISILWVTHDLEQAARVADHAVVMLDGRVVPDHDARRYLHARSFASDPSARTDRPQPPAPAAVDGADRPADHRPDVAPGILSEAPPEDPPRDPVRDPVRHPVRDPPGDPLVKKVEP